MKRTFIIVFSLIVGISACNNSKSTSEENANDSTKVEANNEDNGSTDADRSIVYIDSDSVLKSYDLYEKSKKELEAKAKQYDADIKGRASVFQNEVEDFKRTVGSMTIQNAKATEQRLALKEQELVQYDESLKKQYMSDEQAMLKKITDNMDDFMERYAKKNNHKMILGYKQGATMWYGDKSLDVTADVIKKLNEEYQSQSKETEKKEDKE